MSICGPFWPPFRRNPSASWYESWFATRRPKMFPGSSGSPSIDSTSPTSSSPMTNMSSFVTLYRNGI